MIISYGDRDFLYFLVTTSEKLTDLEKIYFLSLEKEKRIIEFSQYIISNFNIIKYRAILRSFDILRFVETPDERLNEFCKFLEIKPETILTTFSELQKTIRDFISADPYGWFCYS